MPELIQLLEQIQELAGVGIDALKSAAGEAGGGAPAPEGAPAPQEGPPTEEMPPGA